MGDYQLSLRPDPKYGENKIKEKVMFEKDRHNPLFGRSYYYSKQHEIRDRNNFLYRLRHDLGTDDIDVASQSQSEYSTPSYQSNFEDYYYPMPVSYQEVNKELVEQEPSERPPEKYGFVKHNPPFEHRRQNVRECAAVLKLANARLRPGEIKLSRTQKEVQLPIKPTKTVD